MDKKSLKKLIEEDALGLLKVKPKSSITPDDDRLVASFLEINKFIAENKRLPEPKQNDVMEFKLFSRLESIKSDPLKIEKLKVHDEHHLLENIKTLSSVEDIYNDDPLGLLKEDENSIFEIKNIKKDKTIADYIAKRKPCKDFENFKNIFFNCQADISNNKRKLLPFAKEKQITVGQFFVLKGVLLYIADVFADKKNLRSPRLRIIFENETEADLLGHSLGAALYKDGRRVSEHEENLMDGLKDITSDDVESGFIYVLKSKSELPEIKKYQDLFKVGFSSLPVEQRIKNAHEDPTFLLAPVQIVSTFKCFNLNPQKLELLLHKFFGMACLNIEIEDLNGKRFVPREWFIAPLEIIEQAIHYILNGEIVNFRYDSQRKEIVGR